VSTTPQGRNLLALLTHTAVLRSGWPDTFGAHCFGDCGAGNPARNRISLEIYAALG
jgi:hypothetical protein